MVLHGNFRVIYALFIYFTPKLEISSVLGPRRGGFEVTQVMLREFYVSIIINVFFITSEAATVHLVLHYKL